MLSSQFVRGSIGGNGNTHNLSGLVGVAGKNRIISQAHVRIGRGSRGSVKRPSVGKLLQFLARGNGTLKMVGGLLRAHQLQPAENVRPAHSDVVLILERCRNLKPVSAPGFFVDFPLLHLEKSTLSGVALAFWIISHDGWYSSNHPTCSQSG